MSNNMCMSFGEIGSAKAERELSEQDHVQTNNPVDIKPFTTKAPVTTIEALDAVASTLGMTRNALVLKLINQYLGQAFASYSLGYHSAYEGEAASDSVVIGDLEKMLDSANFDHPDTKDYLSRLVINSLQEDF